MPESTAQAVDSQVKNERIAPFLQVFMIESTKQGATG
jgi:hypothetical protein